LGIADDWVPHGISVADFIASYVDKSTVIGWVGPDESLWNGISTNTLQAEFITPVRSADSWGRPILLNHAPRGSTAEPGNFDLLLPYLDLSDMHPWTSIPFPQMGGHSILPEHPGLSVWGTHKGF
jgi:hypothetical protein